MPLDAPIVAVLEEDALLSAVRPVARSTLAAYLDVELDKVHPRRVQIPAHQLSFPSLSKGQKNPGQWFGNSLAFYSLVSSPQEQPALQKTVLVLINMRRVSSDLLFSLLWLWFLLLVTLASRLHHWSPDPGVRPCGCGSCSCIHSLHISITNTQTQLWDSWEFPTMPKSTKK